MEAAAILVVATEIGTAIDRIGRIKEARIVGIDVDKTKFDLHVYEHLRHQEVQSRTALMWW